MLNNKYDFLLHVQCQIDCKPSVSFASKLYIQVRRTYKYVLAYEQCLCSCTETHHFILPPTNLSLCIAMCDLIKHNCKLNISASYQAVKMHLSKMQV